MSTASAGRFVASTDRPPPWRTLHFAAERPQVLAMPADGCVGQSLVQQMEQEWREHLNDLLAHEDVRRLGVPGSGPVVQSGQAWSRRCACCGSRLNALSTLTRESVMLLARLLQRLAIIGAAAHGGMQAEALDVGAQRLLEVGVPGHVTLQRQHLLAGAWAKGDAVRTGGGLQRPERAGLVRIGVVVGHIGLVLLFDEHPLCG